MNNSLKKISTVDTRKNGSGGGFDNAIDRRAAPGAALGDVAKAQASGTLLRRSIQ
jgi:hypothetical protein